MPDREEFYQTVLDGLGRYLESHFIADVLDAIRRFPAAELHYALNKNQMASKKWLLDELHRAVGGRLGTVRILGGWYGERTRTEPRIARPWSAEPKRH